MICRCARRDQATCGARIPCWTCTRPAFHEGEHFGGWPSDCAHCEQFANTWPNVLDEHYAVLRELAGGVRR